MGTGRGRFLDVIMGGECYVDKCDHCPLLPPGSFGEFINPLLDLSIYLSAYFRLAQALLLLASIENELFGRGTSPVNKVADGITYDDDGCAQLPPCQP